MLIFVTFFFFFHLLLDSNSKLWFKILCSFLIIINILSFFYFLIFSWEELCEDVALEKAGWYFESSKQKKSDSINPDIDFDQENCLRFFGLNNLAVSSSQFPEAQPSTRIRRLVTW